MSEAPNDERSELLRKPSRRVAEGRLLYSGTFGTAFRVSSWSPIGGHLLVTASVDRGIGALAVPTGDALAASEPFVTGAATTSGQFSPNGRWVLYQGAVPGGGAAVFVEAFPSRGLKLQIAEAGINPRWQPDGRQLYYQAGVVLTAMPVSEVGGMLQFGSPREVIEVISGRPGPYDVSADGGRILTLVTSERRAAQPLTLVQNWLVR